MNNEQLKITKLSPQSNYERNRDALDNEQLADGKIVATPMWVKKESIGWVGESVVKIYLSRSKSAVRTGIIRLHMGFGTYAGIALPRRIDVYSINTSNDALHVGSYMKSTQDSLLSGLSHWLEVPVSGVGSDLVVVVHADGNYIQLDEVEFLPSSIPILSQPDKGELDSITIDKIEDNSIERLRLSVQKSTQNFNEDMTDWRLKFGKDKLLAWQINPWKFGSNEDHIFPEPSDNISLNITGVDNEFEQVAIALLNTGKLTMDIDVSIDGSPHQSYDMYELTPVLSSDGQLIYDPLVPITSKLVLTTERVHVLWLKFNLKNMGVGSHELKVNLQNNNKRILESFDVTIDVDDSTRLEHSPLRATVWGYSADTPIWKDKQKAVEDQVSHYINTWIVHPSIVPGVNLSLGNYEKQWERFDKELALYKGKGIVRLFFGWKANKNPLGISHGNYEIDEQRKLKFKQWLLILNQRMEQNSYEHGQWELYPIDEVVGDGAFVLKAIAEVVQDVLPRAKIYANPVSSYTHRTNIRHLNELRDLVDSWQPGLHLLIGDNNKMDFFKNLNRQWGFYQNPRSPAKTASPINIYRNQGWYAWALGASAVGFWSYSDSTRSSVWNDFDGRRPDYSVVYEAEDNIITSRRWEAFAEGIEDYQLLEGSGLSLPLGIEPESISMKQINRFRETALKRLKN